MDTITLTFGDCAENHVGMQKIGEISGEGFSIDDLKNVKEKFEKENFICDLYDLTSIDDIGNVDEASTLVIRKACDYFVNTDLLFEEQKALDYDKKAFMWDRVVNKHARYNLCFADYSQSPDYENKKGRIVKYDDVPITKDIRSNLDNMFGQKAKDLMLEGNYYYDIKKCGIGFHGDTERRKVVGLRLGKTMPLVYQWYENKEKIGSSFTVELNHGDMYMMSVKATGFDWKKRKIKTLRHAAGCKKYIEQ